jgi:hypothetical protein
MSSKIEKPPQIAASQLRPLSAALQASLDELRAWTEGELPKEAFAACASAWPQVREYFLEEWRLDLADPEREAITGAIPAVGLHLAAANADAAFVDVLLLGMHLETMDQDVLFGDMLIEFGPALMAMMARNSPDAIAKLEKASMPAPEVEPDYNSVPLDALALLVDKGAYERARLDDHIRKIDVALSDEKFSPERTVRREWIATVLANCGPGDLLELLRGWFAEMSESEAPFVKLIGLEDVEESACETREKRVRMWYNLHTWDDIEKDAYESLRWMMDDSLGDIEDDSPDEPMFIQEPLSSDDSDVPTLPLARTDPKIGRNDSCPCGSGKKYKKCCGNS